MLNSRLLFSLPLLILFSLEMIYRGSFSGAAVWFIHHPAHFVINYGVVFGLVNLFYILPRRLYLTLSAFLLAIFAGVGLVSRQKLLLRGEPLLPWDLQLSKEALTISQTFTAESSPDISFFMAVMLVVFGILLSLFIISKEKYRPGPKVLTACLSLILFVSFTGYLDFENRFSVQRNNWSQKMNYEENGMLVGFLLNTKYLSIDEPVDYAIRTIKNILGEGDSEAPYAVDPDFQPNVIVVMSEAFWDPTVLDTVEFSEDPIPYFRSLQHKHTRGVLLSPVYGGGTANTEFEVLTGLSTQFLPGGIVPYVQFVHKPLEALPAIYKRQGYEATAIHTYDNWFYRRNTVYKDLGFDKYISKEFFTEPEYAGPYIRDMELSYRILSQIQHTDKPDFIFAVSMQAHGPYSPEANPDNRIKVTGDLSDQTQAILENYTNTIADVDQSLKVLIDGLKKLKEPPVVVFFGDHLPMLGNNFDVYREAHFFSDEDTQPDYLKKYSVPLVVWDNFSRTKEELRLSASFLGSYILERSKSDGSPLTDFLYTLHEKGSNVICAARYLDHEQITDEELAQYRLLQYDFLNGNEYAYELKPLHRPAPNEVYTLGESPATIVEVLVPDEGTLQVLGTSFSPNHQIYVNNKPLTTNFVDNTQLIASLPAEYLSQSGSLEIQLKLKDSMKNVISESNIYPCLELYQ